MQAHEVRKCTDMLAQVAEEIQTQQRDMSRDVIEPTVQDTMTEGYAACCAEAGLGQFERMRRLMRTTVERHKSSMFAEAAGLLRMCCLVASIVHFWLFSAVLFDSSAMLLGCHDRIA